MKDSNNAIILRNPRFWSVVILTLFVSTIYLGWPWRPWQSGIWRWIPEILLNNLGMWEAKHKIFGILYIIPITVYFVFQWSGKIQWYRNIAILAFLGLCPIFLAFSLGFSTFMKNTFILLLPLLIVLVINFEKELRQKDRDFLSQQENQRRLYTARILETNEQTRQTIAQELHDETIQNLLAIASFARVLESDAGDDNIKTRAAIIRDVSLKSAEGVRRIVQALKPKILDDLGLVPALNRLVSSINEENSIRAKIFIDGNERDLGKQADIIIFRIVQEALNNIKIHANATEAIINFEYFNDGVGLLIADNGRGFNTSIVRQHLTASGKMGLIGIRERAESLGGTLEIRSGIGQGTTLSVNLKC